MPNEFLVYKIAFWLMVGMGAGIVIAAGCAIFGVFANG